MWRGLCPEALVARGCCTAPYVSCTAGFAAPLFARGRRALGCIGAARVRFRPLYLLNDYKLRRLPVALSPFARTRRASFALLRRQPESSTVGSCHENGRYRWLYRCEPNAFIMPFIELLCSTDPLVVGPTVPTAHKAPFFTICLFNFSCFFVFQATSARRRVHTVSGKAALYGRHSDHYDSTIGNSTKQSHQLTDYY